MADKSYEDGVKDGLLRGKEDEIKHLFDLLKEALRPEVFESIGVRDIAPPPAFRDPKRPQ